MSTTATDLWDTVLSLPVEQRIALVNELLASLNPREGWAKDAERLAQEGFAFQ
jgi:hypothetical protein